VRNAEVSWAWRYPLIKITGISPSEYRYLLLNDTGIALQPKFYFIILTFATRGVCEHPHGPWGVLTTAGPADKHDPTPCGTNLRCQGSTTDRETRFLIQNFALKCPGTWALPLMYPREEHSILPRRSWRTQKFPGSSIPKTNEALPPRSHLPCSRKEERW
jgi:hypothetical protein